jgi:hypothetical protein
LKVSGIIIVRRIENSHFRGNLFVRKIPLIKNSIALIESCYCYENFSQSVKILDFTISISQSQFHNFDSANQNLLPSIGVLTSVDTVFNFDNEGRWTLVL